MSRVTATRVDFQRLASRRPCSGEVEGAGGPVREQPQGIRIARHSCERVAGMLDAISEVPEVEIRFGGDQVRGDVVRVAGQLLAGNVAGPAVLPGLEQHAGPFDAPVAHSRLAFFR
jgi:hypothetical protein